jgi:hypothetical protein
MADTAAAHRLGGLAAAGPGLIDRLVGIAVDSLANQAELAMAGGGKLTAAQARTLLARVQEQPPLPGFADMMNTGERLFYLDYAMTFIRTDTPATNPDRRVSLEWDVVLREANRLVDRAVEACGNATFPERTQAMTAIIDELQKTARDAGMGKYTADDFAKLIDGYADKPVEERERISKLVVALEGRETLAGILQSANFCDAARMRRQLSIVALALAACKAEKGEFPKALAELAPTYLKAVPEDLFVGKPLHYKRTDEGYLLYSVGPDMVDDGGESTSGIGPDIVVKFPPLPKPPPPGKTISPRKQDF